MDGIDEVGTHSWASPNAQKQAEFGIVDSWAADAADVAAAKQTWVFKDMGALQRFLHDVGPCGLTLAIWKKWRRPEFLHATYVSGTQAPQNAVSYGKVAWQHKGGATRERRRPDTVAVLTAKGHKHLARANTAGSKPSYWNPVVMKREFVCDGGHKAWGKCHGDSPEACAWKARYAGAVRRRNRNSYSIENKPSMYIRLFFDAVLDFAFVHAQ